MSCPTSSFPHLFHTLSITDGIGGAAGVVTAEGDALMQRESIHSGQDWREDWNMWKDETERQDGIGEVCGI